MAVAALAATAALLAGCAQQAVAGHAVPGQGLHAAGLADRTQLDLGATEAVPAAVPPAYIDVTGQGQELPRDVDGARVAGRPWPGAKIVHRRLDADGDAGATDMCTLGPAVRGPHGRVGFITAGHCDNRAHPDQYLATPGGELQRIGDTAGAVVDAAAGIDSAVVWLPAVMPAEATRLALLYPVTGVMSEARARALPIGTMVCQLAAVSGLTCGPKMLTANSNMLQFRAHGASGDSGGAVFVVSPQREATLVGIVKDGAYDGSDVGATYLAPVLERLGADAITN